MAYETGSRRLRPVGSRKKKTAPKYGPTGTGCPVVEEAVARLYRDQSEAHFWDLMNALNYALELKTRVLVPLDAATDPQSGAAPWAALPIPEEKAEDLPPWLLHTRRERTYLPLFTSVKTAEAERTTATRPMAERGMREAMAYALNTEGLDGVVIACVDFNHPQVQELVDSGLPLVTIDHEFNNRLAVTSDNLCGTEALVRHVYEAGHRHIAFIHGEDTAVTQNRLTSYYRALEALGLEAEPDYVRAGRYHDPECCARETAALLALPQPPTCILFPDDFSAIGGLNTIAAAGLRVPDDISVAGYDGIYLSQTMSPRLTTYRQDTAALGRTAAARLIELIEKPRTTVMDRTVVTGALLPGGTVASPRTE